MRKQLINLISVFFILLLFGCTGNIEIPTTSEPENTQTSDNGNSNKPTGDNPGTNPTSGTDDKKSSSSPVYTITIADLTNGSVTPDKTSAKAEETVTLTVTPEWGYELDSLTVTDSNNKAVTITDRKFTMPAANVTVNVSFKKIAFSWENGVDSNIEPESDCGTITDFTVAETADGCSFHIAFTTDDRAEDSYSQSHVAVRNVYVKGGVLYKFSWQDFSNYGTISLASFWLDRAQKLFSAGASNSLITPNYDYINYVYFKTDEDDVLTITFRPNHVSGDYVISNFTVEPEIPDSDTEYTITMPDALSNGTATVDKTTAKVGETVTFTVTPDWGYYSYIWVTDSNNNRILVTDNKFKMPSSNVTVSVRFSQFDSSNYEWVCGVDDPKPADPGEMTNYQSSGSGCSFDIQFKDDEPYDGSYSASKVAVKNIYVKGGVLYRFSWTSYLKKDNSILKGTSIKLNGFYLNRAQKWLDSAIPNNNIISYTSERSDWGVLGWVTDNSVYCIFEADDVIDVVFRPVHISASYRIYNFKVEETCVHNVTFDTNGGSAAPAMQIVPDGENAVKPAEPTKAAGDDNAGYVFKGWDKDGIDFDFKTPIKENITLTARWNPLYTVICAIGGEDVGSIVQVVENESKATVPDEPTKQGYVFKGWRLNGSNDNFNFAKTPITGNTTLYAQWNPLYSVSFNTDGGSTAPETQIIENGNKATAPADPTKEGYIFKGWRLNGSNDNYNFADTCINGNIELTAKWSPSRKVTFNSNGGSDVLTQTVEKGYCATVPPAPTKTGYVFYRWQYNGNDYDFSEPINEDITLTAKWYHGTKAPEEEKEVLDIVFKDGSATPYTWRLKLDDVQKSAMVAVIFYKGTELNSGNDTTTTRTLGVGVMVRSELIWCTSNASAYDKDITTIQCRPIQESNGFVFTDDTANDRNGSDNLEQIGAFLREKGFEDDTAKAENYPAFYFAKNYKDVEGSNVKETAYENGWYLPSAAELFMLYKQNIGNIIAQFSTHEIGSQCLKICMSSSQCDSSADIPSGNGSYQNCKYELSYASFYGVRKSVNTMGVTSSCAIREF